MFTIETTLLVFSAVIGLCQAYEDCNNGYYCTSGYCCGYGECCTYTFSIYSRWWFWIIVIVALIIKCACIGCWYNRRRSAAANAAPIVIPTHSAVPQVPPSTQPPMQYGQEPPAYPTQQQPIYVNQQAPPYPVQIAGVSPPAYECPPPKYPGPPTDAKV